MHRFVFLRRDEDPHHAVAPRHSHRADLGAVEEFAEMRLGLIGREDPDRQRSLGDLLRTEGPLVQSFDWAYWSGSDGPTPLLRNRQPPELAASQRLLRQHAQVLRLRPGHGSGADAAVEPDQAPSSSRMRSMSAGITAGPREAKGRKPPTAARSATPGAEEGSHALPPVSAARANRDSTRPTIVRLHRASP